jgi:hypothetical protein
VLSVADLDPEPPKPSNGGGKCKCCSSRGDESDCSERVDPVKCRCVGFVFKREWDGLGGRNGLPVKGSMGVKSILSLGGMGILLSVLPVLPAHGMNGKGLLRFGGVTGYAGS